MTIFANFELSTQRRISAEFFKIRESVDLLIPYCSHVTHRENPGFFETSIILAFWASVIVVSFLGVAEGAMLRVDGRLLNGLKNANKR